MLKTFSRSFRPAAWLGWQVESNWTDPLMFFAFQILRPVASVLILVFMYRVVAGAGAARVVAFGCDLGETAPAGTAVEQWADVPAVSDDLPAARAAIQRHLERLVDECARSARS